MESNKPIKALIVKHFSGLVLEIELPKSIEELKKYFGRDSTGMELKDFLIEFLSKSEIEATESKKPTISVW